MRYFMQATSRSWSAPGDYVSPYAQFWQRDQNIVVGNSKVDQVVKLAEYPTRRNPPMATYPDLTANAPFTQASKTSGGSNSPVNRLVVHHTVSKTQRGGAQATANGFASSAAGGSAHYTVDPGAVVQSVKESVIAWHAPPNSNSIGVEMTDLCIWQAYPSSNAGQLDSRFANNEGAFHARWSLPDWQEMLARTALVFRHEADVHSVPIVRLSVADVKAGKRGICGHREVSLAFGQSSHIDPYACDSCSGDFPWGQFMDMVQNPDKAVAIIGGTITNPGDDVGNVDTISDAAAEKIAWWVLHNYKMPWVDPVTKVVGPDGHPTQTVGNIVSWNEEYTRRFAQEAKDQILTAVDEKLKNVQAPTIDVEALGKAIAANLPDSLVKAVAAEVGERIKNG
jgi:hypothetical protein